MAALIEIQDLTNRFGSHVVHDRLNLTLQKDEILGLVGGSGSGKSVLLRSILGLHAPNGGKIMIGGKDMRRMDKRERLALQRRWGVLFQDGALFSGMDTLDNIAFPLREHSGLDGRSIEELARFKLGMVGLKEEAAHKFPSDLSGGMARRAGLARALALDPEILFLDEPTAGLDPLAAAAFDDLILALRDMLELTVMIITHDLDTLTGICDRIAMIVDRKVICGTLEEMMNCDHPEVRAYFNGPRMRAVPERKKA